MTKNYPDQLSFIEWFQLLDQLKDCGVKKVIFTGGEIGLNHDSLKYIDYAYQLGLSVGLITNGTLIGKKECTILGRSMRINDHQLGFD